MILSPRKRYHQGAPEPCKKKFCLTAQAPHIMRVDLLPHLLVSSLHTLEFPHLLRFFLHLVVTAAAISGLPSPL